MAFSRIPPRLHGFVKVSTDELEEFHARGTLFVHQKTGLRVYHMEAPDRENLFCFLFPTPPTDDTGVPHILEHTVLCGSRRYPTKDPFLYLLKSSLHTFLNAMTYPDKTVYPGASIVPKDFYNLFRVYADAVFYPLLKPQAFAQEGHRLEWDEAGALTYSGVVYNEMKGSYSSSEGRIADAVFKAVFDQGAYSKDSGGQPASIVKLTYQDFLKFHQDHYHPSQATVFLYGDQGPAEALKILDHEVLKNRTRRDLTLSVAPQPRWTAPRTVKALYPAGADEDKEGTLALVWVCADVLDHDRVLELDILSEVLLGDAGLLQKILLESGLGQDLSPVSGLESDLRDVCFAVGLRGAGEAKKEAFENLVFDSLRTLADQGIPRDLVEGLVATYEFSIREIKGGGMGLRFLRRLGRSWLHGASPAEALAFSPRINRLKARLEKGEPVFEELIRQALLTNPHRALVSCVPDPEIHQKEAEAVQDELAQLRIKATAEELEKIKQDQAAFQAFQEESDSPRAIASLPQLKLKDIPAKVEIIESVWDDDGQLPLALHEAFTNGVVYADLSFDISFLGPDEVVLLPLFQRLLDSLGLVGQSWDLLAREISLKTGGVSFRATCDSQIGEGRPGLPVSRFWVRCKMLEEKTEPALELLSRILKTTDWGNTSRMKDLVLEMRNDFQAALVPRGHLFASTWTASRFTQPSRFGELTAGLAQLDFLGDQAAACAAPGGTEALLSRLQALASRIFRSQGVCSSLTGQGPALTALAQGVRTLVKSFPAAPQKPEPWASLAPEWAYHYRTIPSSVGFNAYTIRSTFLNDSLHPAELVLSQRLKTGHLWETIRMQGGAYGAFSFNNGLEGFFTFATYRDPGVNFSFDAFRESLLDTLAHPLDRREKDILVIGTAGNDLNPRSPAEDGYLFLQRRLLGITDEMRQKKRDGLIRLGTDGLSKAAQNLLDVFAQGVGLSLTSETLAQQAQGEGTRSFQKIG